MNNPPQTWIWEPTTMQHYCIHQGQGAQQANYHGSREHLFEKSLTPSDVGKLNRLVIPKQHAEKHFPLDSESGEKGLLLSFEDESGKAWRFRYSYWSSSQSYVLTKGWSRYVKEKKLDAGDIVQFERYRATRGDDRFFIGCRRRMSDGAGATARLAEQANEAAPEAMLWSPYVATPYFYMNSVSGGVQAGTAAADVATGSTKRLRLFGVNLECWTDGLEPPQHLISQSWSRFMPTNTSTSQL